MLKLSDYREAIKLDTPVPAAETDDRSTHDLLLTALAGLKDKKYTGGTSANLSTDAGLDLWLKTELAERPAGDLDPITSRAIDTLLWRRMDRHGRIEVKSLRRVIDLNPDSDYTHADSVVLYRGDSEQIVVDAIVTSAMPDLSGCPLPFDHCIDSEIQTQGGPWIKSDLKKIKEITGIEELPLGEAVITRGYRLPAKYVIHTVSPKASGGNHEDRLKELYDTYIACLNLAAQVKDIKSVAFPAIGTGMGGFSLEESAQVALKAVDNWFDEHSGKVELVALLVRGDHDSEAYQHALDRWVED